LTVLCLIPPSPGSLFFFANQHGTAYATDLPLR
jgi:hypothetical protein